MMAKNETVAALDEVQEQAVELGDDFTVGGGTVKKRKLLFEDLSTLSKSVSSSDGFAEVVGSEIVSGVREGVQEFVEKQSKAKRRRTRRTPKQFNDYLQKTLLDNKSIGEKYSMALKDATRMYNERDGSSTLSLQKICDQMNAKYCLNGKKKLNRMTLSNYISKGLVGSSPLKMSYRAKVPDTLLELMRVHISMCQVSGLQEAKSQSIKALIGAAILGMRFEEEFTVEWIYKKLRHKFPNVIVPSRELEVEDRRASWTTYPNINVWFDGAKKILIESGLVEDRPMRVIDMFEGHPLPFEISGEY